MSPNRSSQTGGSLRTLMNTFDTNATGSRVALARAGADWPDGATEASARPRRENDATPTTKVTAAGSTLPRSISMP